MKIGKHIHNYPVPQLKASGGYCYWVCLLVCLYVCITKKSQIRVISLHKVGSNHDSVLLKDGLEPDLDYVYNFSALLVG